MDSLRGQLASKGAEIAGQMETAAGLASDKASMEARLREAERAKSRCELEASQPKEVGRLGAGGGVAAQSGAGCMRGMSCSSCSFSRCCPLAAECMPA